jgi:hypothetical protein
MHIKEYCSPIPMWYTDVYSPEEKLMENYLFLWNRATNRVTSKTVRKGEGVLSYFSLPGKQACSVV